MKIQKFNESVSKDELKTTILSLSKNDLYKKLNDYLYWKSKKDNRVYDYGFINDKFRISFRDDTYGQWFLEFEDFNEINDFINNPELFKKTKNYNL